MLCAMGETHPPKILQMMVNCSTPTKIMQQTEILNNNHILRGSLPKDRKSCKVTFKQQFRLNAITIQESLISTMNCIMIKLVLKMIKMMMLNLISWTTMTMMNRQRLSTVIQLRIDKTPERKLRHSRISFKHQNNHKYKHK